MAKGTKGLRLNPTFMRAIGEKYVYSPYGAALKVFHLHDEEILLVGPKGTGKSLGVLHKIHAVLAKYPNAKGFMARKTRASMTNSCVDMFERHVLKPPDRVHLHKQDQQFQYPNGSICAVLGLDEPMRLQSSEWDIGYIQEATEASEDDWEMCTGLLRSGVVPYQQLIGDCNPDKPTHWLKKRCDLGKTTMLMSTHKDNPKYWDQKRNKPTPLGEKYLGKLNRLSGHRRNRLYLGHWSAAEGMVYENYDPNMHLIYRNQMPHGYEKWVHYWAIDWGHIHPFTWQDWIENPETGCLVLNQQIYVTGNMVEDLARHIKDMTAHKYIPRAVICDHDAEDRKVFEKHTLYPTLPAYKHIQVGIQAVQSRMEPNWKGTGLPGILMIRDSLCQADPVLVGAGSPTCVEQEIDGYVWDKKHNLQVNSRKDELPVDKDNHGMDALRYIVAFIDNLAEDPQDIDELVEFGEEEIISLY